MHIRFETFALAIVVFVGPFSAHAADKTQVVTATEIGANRGGYTGPCGFWEDGFGASAAAAGLFDEDGVPDVFVGSPENFDKGPREGNVWLFLLNADGSVRELRDIGPASAGLEGALERGDRFGASVANLGDIDGDGVTDIAVGAPGADAGGASATGSVWILHLDDDATVKNRTSFNFSFAALDSFGASVATVADMDSDGIPELLVGEPGARAVWIARLNADGTPKNGTKYDNESGNLPEGTVVSAGFGRAVASPGDVDDNGTADVAVADKDNVWVFLLDSMGAAISAVRLAGGMDGIPDAFPGDSDFGSSLGAGGDIDEDGIPDLLVGASGKSEVWAVFLDTDGTAKGARRLSTPETAFDDDEYWRFTSFRRFGSAIALLGDLDGNGVDDVVAGDDRFLCPDVSSTTTSTRVCPTTTSTTSTTLVTTTTTTTTTLPSSGVRRQRATSNEKSKVRVVRRLTKPRASINGDGQCPYLFDYDVCGDPKFRPSGGESIQVLLLDATPCSVGDCDVNDECIPCGRPASKTAGTPNATDALTVLAGAIGTAPCGLCVCDIDSDGSVSATDALALLFEVVGLPGGESPNCVRFD